MTMPDNEASLLKDRTRDPWNKGKIIGAKPPLRPRPRLVDQNTIDGRGANP
jgi:hypothetical protein